MTSVSLFSEANFFIDVDATKMSAAAGRDSYGRPVGLAGLTNRPSTNYVASRSDRYFGSTWLRSSFLRQMQKFAGVDLASPDILDTSDDNVLHMVRMTHIVKSSTWHAMVLLMRKTAAI